MRAAELDLDLDVFAGPFDLLMAVVLREEMSLAEVALGEIVVAYLEHLESAGELDLDAATEFLVLIASLLELKSRLLLPSRGRREPELGPEEAADELLARMLEYRRYRDAAAHLSRACSPTAPLPVPVGSAAAGAAARLARGGEPGRTSRSGSPRPSATCCGCRRRRTRATSGPPSRSSAGSRVLRELLVAPRALRLRRGRSRAEDRLTQAVTLFALLEMHKRGEATWEQRSDLFGPIEVRVA